jgi:quercetin dioxygenase-like cupin family protein
MQRKFNNATEQRPMGDRIIDAKQVTIDLPFFIKQIREEKQWKESDRNAITVFKTNGMRIVLIGLHEGAEMSKHKADGLMSIQVVEGKVLFNTEDECIALGKGQMLALHKDIPHSIAAEEETIILLTLTTTLAAV